MQQDDGCFSMFGYRDGQLISIPLWRDGGFLSQVDGTYFNRLHRVRVGQSGNHLQVGIKTVGMIQRAPGTFRRRCDIVLLKL